MENLGSFSLHGARGIMHVCRGLFAEYELLIRGVLHFSRVS